MNPYQQSGKHSIIQHSIKNLWDQGFDAFVISTGQTILEIRINEYF